MIRNMSSFRVSMYYFGAYRCMIHFIALPNYLFSARAEITFMETALVVPLHSLHIYHEKINPSSGPLSFAALKRTIVDTKFRLLLSNTSNLGESVRWFCSIVGV